MLYKSLIVSAIAFGIAFLVVPSGNIESGLDALRFFTSLIACCCGIVSSVSAGIMFISKS